MTPLPIRGLWLDRETHDALGEFAWLNRTTKGDAVRAILDTIRNDPNHGESVLAVEDRPGRVKLTMKSSDEQWNGAVNAALPSGISFNSLVRRHLIKVLTEEGLL